MLKLETIFANKAIIHGLTEPELPKFVEHVIKYTWVNSTLPASARFVKESENPTLDKMPVGFNLKETVERAVKRNVLLLETLGPVYLGLNVRITNQKAGASPGIRVEFDKFMFERDDRFRNVAKFLGELIKAWEGAKEVVKVPEAPEDNPPPAKVSPQLKAKRGRPRKAK